jgi:hypothetical protein
LLVAALACSPVASAQEPRRERAVEVAPESASRRPVELGAIEQRRRLRAERRRDPQQFVRAREHLRREQWERIRTAFPPRVVVTPSTGSRTVVYVPEDVRGELLAHARRIAALERIREISYGRWALVARIDSLIRREMRRHSTRMASFGIQVVP